MGKSSGVECEDDRCEKCQPRMDEAEDEWLKFHIPSLHEQASKKKKKIEIQSELDSKESKKLHIQTFSGGQHEQTGFMFVRQSISRQRANASEIIQR